MSEENPYASPRHPSDPLPPGESPDVPRSVPEHILTARTSEGAKVTERVEAASGDAAVEILRQRGYSEIVLHTDDVTAAYGQPEDTKEFVSARDYIGFRKSGGYLHDVLTLTRRMYLGGWVPVLVLVGLLLLWRASGIPWGPWDLALIGLIIAMLVAPVPIAIVAPLLSSMHGYARLIEDVSWGRWQAVLERLPRLRRQIPGEEYAFRHAGALAGLGGLDEALKIVEPLGDGAQMPRWLFLGRLAEVYSIAKVPDQTIACCEKAVELAPDNVTVLVDLAMTLLRHRRDTQRARELLEKARSHALSDMVEPFVLMTEGVLALEESDPAKAQRLLQESILKMSPFARANAWVGATIAESHAYLTLVCTAIAETDSAHTHFRLAEPRLRALKEDDLIGRCQQALGIPRDSEQC